MRYWSVALILVILFGGCAPQDAPVASPPGILPPGTVTCTLRPINLLPPRSGEYYNFWIRTYSDSSWRFVAELPNSSLSKSAKPLVESLGLSMPEDSIKEAVVSLDSVVRPDQPTLLLLSGLKTGATIILRLSKTIGDFSTASGSAIFTTAAADTAQAKREFYLAKKIGAELTPSLQNLPALPQGWSYGLWIMDSSFTPIHKYFFGVFEKASGHDSDSATDAFEFPGGVRSSSLESAGNTIRVTLEPQYQVPKLRTLGPSPFTVLYSRLSNFIHLDQEFLLQVSATLPEVVVTLATAK